LLLVIGVFATFFCIACDANEQSADATPLPILTIEPSKEPTPSPLPIITPIAAYEEAKALNPDVIGWIQIPDTNIDHPVVHSHDNEDYVVQSVAKMPSKSGAIFLDFRAGIDGKHLIIYGMNMSKSQTMFAQLTKYAEHSFYDDHRTFELTFGDTEYTYKVFAVYSIDRYEARHMNVKFDNDDQFAYYMNDMLAVLSAFPVDMRIGANDQVVTLVTADNEDSANGLFVVHAVRVDE